MSETNTRGKMYRFKKCRLFGDLFLGKSNVKRVQWSSGPRIREIPILPTLIYPIGTYT